MHNGYVIYPDSVGKATLKEASKYAREASRREPGVQFRVENCTTQKILRRFQNGKRRVYVLAG